MRILVRLIIICSSFLSLFFSLIYNENNDTILGETYLNLTPQNFYSQADNLEVVLTDNRVEVFRESTDNYKIWDSKDKFEKVDTVLFFDIENDGNNELILLIWKYGDYLGERDYLEPIRGEDKLSQHIYIYNLYPYVNLKWGGSTIRQPILNLETCENNTSLCAYESTYDTYPKISKDIVLKWEGWWWDKKYR